MPTMDNTDILTAMASFAKQRRVGTAGTDGGAFHLHRPWDGYIRVSGKGFRSVSVHPDYPLCRFAERPTRRLEKAIGQTPGEPTPFAKSLPKEERCLQAHMIRSALGRELDLLGGIEGSLPFDDLRFAFDEVRLYSGADGKTGKLVRCDLLAVGSRSATTGPNVFEPVLIELKFNRAETRLVEQLDDFTNLVHRYRGQFETMLSAATGQTVLANRVHRVIVWPSRGMREDQVARMRSAGIPCVAYEVSKLEGEGRSRIRSLAVESGESKPSIAG